jgi:hypothetical protein
VIHVYLEVHGSRTVLRLPYKQPSLNVQTDEQPADHADERADDPREQETDIGHGDW